VQAPSLANTLAAKRPLTESDVAAATCERPAAGAAGGDGKADFAAVAR